MTYNDQDSASAINVPSALGEDITDYQTFAVYNFDNFELSEFLSPPPPSPSPLHTEQVESLAISDCTLLVGNGQDADDANTPPSLCDNVRSPRYERFSGWRKGVSTAAITTSVVLCIYFGVAIWAGTKTGTQDGIGILYEGICSNSSQINTGLHLVINILSTLLFGAGNYTMQCLSAPTRAEVDQAHRQGLWLDIGVPSVRNILRIGKGRALLWALLGLSSLPLHLL
ncbi:hypothetical protein MMC34_000321 [Xylographa carneopallida]|nr:hypothetical protein [Xylographa carneopallida]